MKRYLVTQMDLIFEEFFEFGASLKLDHFLEGLEHFKQSYFND
jgi:hypothetical protein